MVLGEADIGLRLDQESGGVERSSAQSRQVSSIESSTQASARLPA